MATRPVVLVVDDEEDFCHSTCMLLEMMGCQAVAINDPGQVLDTIQQDKPALILQDLRMQGLNVAGLMASLHTDPATADVPVVFCSAHPDLAATAQRHGAWGFLRKPFDERALRRVVEQALGTGGAAGGEDIVRDIRDAFHDQWNVISALGNYANVLRAAQLEGPAARAAAGIGDLLLKLEANTDRLQSFVSALAQAQVDEF